MELCHHQTVSKPTNAPEGANLPGHCLIVYVLIFPDQKSTSVS